MGNPLVLVDKVKLDTATMGYAVISASDIITHGFGFMFGVAATTACFAAAAHRTVVGINSSKISGGGPPAGLCEGSLPPVIKGSGGDPSMGVRSWVPLRLGTCIPVSLCLGGMLVCVIHLGRGEGATVVGSVGSSYLSSFGVHRARHSRSFLGSSYEQTLQRFLRGAIDQFIEEHVRKCASGECAAFSKIPILAGLANGTGARVKELRREHSDVPEDGAGDDSNTKNGDPLAKEEALLNYKKFMAQINREECTFSTWSNAVKGFESSSAMAQFKWNCTNNENMRMAISQMFDQAFPVQEAHSIESGDNKARAAHRSAEDYYGVMNNGVKIYMLNGTYCGAISDELLASLPRHVKTTVHHDPENTVYVILGFLRGYGASQERHAPRVMMHKLIKSLTDDPELNLEVNTFTLCFERRSTGGWAGGPMRIEGALCFSADKTKNMEFSCRFAKSALYRNETTGELCKPNPRSSYVCPTNPPVQGYSFPDTSTEKLDRQRYSGQGMYWQLMVALLQGLGLRSKDVAHVREEVAYDGTLAMTLMQMMATPPEHFTVPKFSCSMLLSMGSASSIRNNTIFLDKTLTSFLKSLIKKGFRVSGYDPLPPLDMHASAPGPLDLSLFKVSMPIPSTMALQIREAEWLAVAGHPEVSASQQRPPSPLKKTTHPLPPSHKKRGSHHFD